MSSLIDQLTQSFIKFPGIGPRQARRFVYYLLHTNSATVNNLLQQIVDLRKKISRCSDCHRFYVTKNTAGQTSCELCTDQNRDQSLLMVVEKDIDLENVHKSGTYSGRYFVLGGLAPILDDQPEKTIRLQELSQLVTKLSGSLKEIVIALSVNPEGDYTVDILKKFLSPFIENQHLKISLLGRGLSTGTELEYSDPDTLKNAIKNRS